MDVPSTNKVTPRGVKCKQFRILESSNLTGIFNDLGSELEAEVDFSSESKIEFELLRQLHSDSGTEHTSCVDQGVLMVHQ
jgi:hypothetical protein